MSYTVEIQPSGHRFTVDEGETVLAAALRQGLSLPYGCRSGYCGSCRAELLGGKVEYEDEFPALSEHDARAWALLCQAKPRSDLRLFIREVEGVEDIAVKQVPCKVVRKELLAHDVMRLWLKLPEAQRLQFFAGQYLDIFTPEGRRSFSIANAPHDDAYVELHIRHVEGGEYTHYVFNELTEKTVLRIEAPLGAFFLRENSDRPIILVGGGTGFAPLKGMLEHAFHVGIERPMHLFWGVRAKRDLYSDLPEKWLREHPNFRYTPVLSEPRPEDEWQGETGWVHEAVCRAYPDLKGYDAYMSGPPVMVHTARTAFLRHGLPEERMFSDAFEYNRPLAATS